MSEDKPLHETEVRARAIAEEVAARGVEKIQSMDMTSSLRAVSRALHRAADSFNSDGYRSLAGVTNRAADGCDEFCENTEGRDATTLIRDAQGFARSNPTAFISGCAVVGFLLGRFFATSSEEQPSAYESEPIYESSGEVPTAPLVYPEPDLGLPRGGTP